MITLRNSPEPGADFLAVEAGAGEIEAGLERIRRVVRLANGQTEAE